MRPDVKLGVVVSLVVVLVAGGYYLYRDSRESPILLSDGPTQQGSRPSATTDVTLLETQRSVGSASARPGRGGKTLDDHAAAQGASPQGTGSAPVERRGSPTGGGSERSPTAPRKPRPASERNADAGAPAGQPATKRSPAASRKSTNTTRDRRGATASTAGKRSRAVRSLGAAGARAPRQTPPRREFPAAAPGRFSTSARTLRPDTHAREEDRTNLAVDTHRVQPGDSFASLARAYYGHEKYTRFLIASNPQVPTPNRLRVHDVLKIPPLPTDDRFPRSKATDDITARMPAAPRRTYTVRSGDSFYRIARNVLCNASRWQELLALNKALVQGEPRRLRPGQILKLPER